MIREGFHPDFPDGTDAQVAEIRATLDDAPAKDRGVAALLLISIDNDTSARNMNRLRLRSGWMAGFA